MNVAHPSNINTELPIGDRLVLEKVALERVCPCLYYDLADVMDSTSDDELIAIIEGRYICDMCGGASDER